MLSLHFPLFLSLLSFLVQFIPSPLLRFFPSPLSQYNSFPFRFSPPISLTFSFIVYSLHSSGVLSMQAREARVPLGGVFFNIPPPLLTYHLLKAVSVDSTH